MAALFVIQGFNRGARFELGDHDGAVTIGRESGNFVKLDDHEVSRRHAEIRRVGQTFIVGDLKSSNGTFLNDRQIEQADLRWGTLQDNGQDIRHEKAYLAAQAEQQ